MTLHRLLTGQMDLPIDVDAGDFIEAPCEHVEYLVDQAIPLAMCTQVPIYPTLPNGVAMGGVGPYRFDLDIRVAKNWSEPLTLDECRRLGIPERFGGSC